MKKLLISAFLSAACLLSCVDASGMKMRGINVAKEATRKDDAIQLQSAVSANNIPLNDQKVFGELVDIAVLAKASNVLRYLILNDSIGYFVPGSKQFFDLFNLVLRSGNIEILQLICNNCAEGVVPEMADQFGWEEFIVSVLYSNNEDLVRFICELVPDNFKSDFYGFHFKIMISVLDMTYDVMRLLCEDKLFDKISLHNPEYIIRIIAQQLAELQDLQRQEDRGGPNQSQSDRNKKEEAKKKTLLLFSYLQHNDTGITQYDALRAILSIDRPSIQNEKQSSTYSLVFDLIDDKININLLTTMFYVFEGESLLNLLDWMTDACLQQNFTPIFEYACQYNWTRAIMNLLQLRKEGVKGVDGVQFNAGPGLSCLIKKNKQSAEISSIIAEIISMSNVDLNGKYAGETVIECTVSEGNIELVKLILTNPRVNVLRALRLCKPSSNMWQLLSKYKDQHLECQWIYVKQDILYAITNYDRTKLMAFLKEAVEVTDPTQILPKEQVLEAINKRAQKLEEGDVQQILDILFPNK